MEGVIAGDCGTGVCGDCGMEFNGDPKGRLGVGGFGEGEGALSDVSGVFPGLFVVGDWSICCIY